MHTLYHLFLVLNVLSIPLCVLPLAIPFRLSLECWLIFCWSFLVDQSTTSLSWTKIYPKKTGEWFFFLFWIWSLLYNNHFLDILILCSLVCQLFVCFLWYWHTFQVAIANSCFWGVFPVFTACSKSKFYVMLMSLINSKLTLLWV